MEPSQIINIILFVGATQGFLLAMVIFGFKHGNKTANILLALFIFFFSLMIFFHSLYGLSEHSSQQLSHEEDSFHNMFLIFGPLIYFYVIALTNQSFKFSFNHTQHLLPLLLAFLLDYILILFDAPVTVQKNYTRVVITLVVIQFSIYLMLSIKALIKYSKGLEETFSSLDKINLDWLRFLIIAQTIIWPVALLVEIFFHNHEAWNFIWILVSVLFYIMGYKGIRQPAIFTGIVAEAVTTKTEPKRKYEKSTLTDEMAGKYFEKLLEYMNSSKAYLEQDLTLPLLATRLSISSHHLSQVINEKRSQNFFEFINSYRIEEAKRLLTDPENSVFNISTIAFDAGFNTLSSFNSVFKKFTKQTPSQFRNDSNKVSANL